MNRSADIYLNDVLAGLLTETERAYTFRYMDAYLARPDAQSISLSLPLTRDTYCEKRLFPFFDGLIPEGWLLDIAGQTWKINPRDRMGLLLACCRDCIGAVSVLPRENAR